MKMHAVPKSKAGCGCLERGLQVTLAVVAAVAAARGVAQAEILGPYTPDENTLHLWHMNEATPPVVDAAANGTDLTALDNGATLGNESFTGVKGFGTALGTYTGNPSQRPGSAGQGCYLSALPLEYGPADNVTIAYAGASEAFTYEAIVRIDFSPTVTFGADGWGQGKNLFMQIINGEADETPNRVFQFRLAPVGVLNGNTSPLLEFINVNKGDAPQSLTAPIPTDGPDAIREGAWYHVAVTYNGQEDQPENLRLYWTSMDPARVAANLIGTGQMTHNLPSGCAPDFAIGQTGRQSPVASMPNNNFVGLIDEVRMSGIARGDTEMMFGVRGALAAKPLKAPVTNTGATMAQSKPKAATAAPKVAIIANRPVEATPVRTPAKPDASAAFTMVNGAIIRGPQDRPRIAIVFSCRETDEGSDVIMQALRAHHAKASFFVSSDFLNWPVNSEFIRTAHAEGHLVGPQSDDWDEFTRAGHGACPTVDDHLSRLAQAGISRGEVRFFLPTSDQLTSTVVDHGREYGMKMITGTPGTLSLKTTTSENSGGFVSSERILESIVNRERSGKNGLNGFQLLFQLDSGDRHSDKFYTRFSEMLDTLQNRGYEFVTLDELLKVESFNWALVQP